MMNTGSEPPHPGGSAASGAHSERAPDTERVRLDLAYDGTDFHGFAENVGVETVGGRLRGAVEQVLGVPVAITCAGRTDAGVHARSQVVTFDLPTGLLDAPRLQKSLNSMLDRRIAVRSVAVVDDGFDARFSATWRGYRYAVLNRAVPDPFLARSTWWITDPLDLDAMRVAARALEGEHDFSSFCRRPKGQPGASLVRRVLRTDWVAESEPGLLRFEIAATAFCHQMVRSIVGTLVDIGRGRTRSQDLATVLEARDRAAAGNIAPPHGLTLWQVGYPGDPVPGSTPIAG
jgi:tRNA pseudouridine38-40 synthase